MKEPVQVIYAKNVFLKRVNIEEGGKSRKQRKMKMCR
jgi:hypothetical protein